LFARILAEPRGIIHRLMPFDPFQPDQLARLGRQLQLREIGAAGQRRLGDASVVVVGLGGLGCPAATYLVAAGVGHLHLVDGDVVEASNLNRQMLFGTADLGRAKVVVAAERLGLTGNGTSITIEQRHVTPGNIEGILKSGEVVLDATDNFATRFLLADSCRLLGKPLVQAAVTQFAGQVATYLPQARPCYRCFFAGPPENGSIPGCAEAGVIGAAAGAVGSLQALETIKLLVGGAQESLSGYLLMLDLWSLAIDRVKLPPDSNCPLCGPHATILTLADAGLPEHA
jgi:molybdopterin/thiamine biosynthesis adenylyltransferase